MKGSDLTAEQLKQLLETLTPKLRYISMLKNRMSQRQFAAEDRMYRDVQMAEMALQDLVAEARQLLNYKRVIR